MSIPKDFCHFALNGRNLIQAKIFGAGLTGGDLRAANLTGADLTGANLSSAILDYVTWPNRWKLVRD